MDAVQITNVTKTFGDRNCRRRPLAHRPEGSVYGFIGPNGSGKTTTMRMIVNIFYPDCGDIRVFGKPDVGRALRTRSAICPKSAACTGK